MFAWVNGKNPRRYGFDFGFWTQQIVRELIEQKCGARLSLARVSTVLARLGLTPQELFAANLSAARLGTVGDALAALDTYQAIARQTKQKKVEIYFFVALLHKSPHEGRFANFRIMNS
ncbi:MAG: winged helix-turn-helix domain-containing protein [Burkholderia sp.]